jgi:type I restriction enzyme S subunit
VKSNGNRPLPHGWKWVRLGEVAKYINGRAFKPSEWTRAGLPIIRIQNLNNPGAPYNYFDGDVDGRHRVGDGDLLISWSASLDAFLWDRGPAVLNQHIFKVVEKPHLIERSFLYFAAREVMDEVRRRVHGATMQHITKGKFESIRIPLPPVPEQRSISSILTERMATLSRARTAAEVQLTAAAVLPAAYLRMAFEDSQAQVWPVVPLGEVGEIGSGITLGRRMRDQLTRPVPYLRVANVKDGYLLLDDVKEIEATEAEVERYALQQGDLLLTEGGDPDKLGRGTVWNEEIPECIHQNHIFRVRFDPSLFLPEFLSAQIGSSYGKRYFLAHAKQTTGIATINQKVLRNFPLLVPDLSTQQRVIEELATRISAAEELRTALEAQLTEINALEGATLRQAFSGELVPVSVATGDTSSPRGIFFKRGAIASYTIDRLHRRKEFGRVQFEKVLYLSETYVGVDLRGEYQRAAAGPLDAGYLYKLESLAAKQGWFTKHKRGAEGYFYRPGPKIDSRAKAAETILGERREKMDRLLALMGRINTEQAEVLATVFAVWNDFLLDGGQPTDDAIIEEVRTNWHLAKARFSPDRLRKALGWMREKDFVPTGIGPRTQVSS